MEPSLRAAPARPPPPPTATAPVPHRFHVDFTGAGAEYFRVWIVNVALTVVTLGIYSAWAKVRNKQYFYGNTRIAGGSFEYTASPLAILKGRILVLGVFIAYQLAATFQPLLALVLALILVPLIPWVVIRAVGFNMRYSAYRGLRFHFDAGYWEAFRVYLLWTVAAVASFGLLYPFVAWRRKQFLVDHARYGRSCFGFSGEVGWFYVVYIVAYLVLIGVVIAGALLMGGVIALVATTAGAGAEDGGMGDVGRGLAIGAAVFAYAGFLLAFLVFNAAVQAMIANHVWQHTRIGDVRFHLDLRLGPIVWIQASNIVAIIASFGLLIPWAKVRMTRYRLSRFTLVAVPAELESFVASERERIEATGAELGEALDLDLGL